jgi:hypothetical protein
VNGPCTARGGLFRVALPADVPGLWGHPALAAWRRAAPAAHSVSERWGSRARGRLGPIKGVDPSLGEAGPTL